MGDAIGFEGIAERLTDRILPDEFQQLLRSIAAGEDGIVVGYGFCYRFRNGRSSDFFDRLGFLFRHGYLSNVAVADAIFVGDLGISLSG